MFAKFILHPKILAQILNDTLDFAFATIRNKIDSGFDVQFAKAKIGVLHYEVYHTN